MMWYTICPVVSAVGYLGIESEKKMGLSFERRPLVDNLLLILFYNKNVLKYT